MIGHSVGEFVAAVLAGVMRARRRRAPGRAARRADAGAAGRHHALGAPAGRRAAAAACPKASRSPPTTARPPASSPARPRRSSSCAPRSKPRASSRGAADLARLPLRDDGRRPSRPSRRWCARSPCRRRAADLLHAHRPPADATRKRPTRTTGRATCARRCASRPPCARCWRQLAHPLFIEVGPRNTLATLVRQHATKAQPAPAVVAARRPARRRVRRLAPAAGRLWAQGVEIDLVAARPRARKRRVRLPTYPFERKRFWVDIASPAPVAPALRFVARPPLSPPSTRSRS